MTDYTSPRVRIQRIADPESMSSTLKSDARDGLTAKPKWLTSKHLYDAAGSELFDLITVQPEYYPTRAERALLDQYGEQIIQRSGATTLVELGSGSSEKTSALLDPLTATAGGAAVYVPVDVSVSALIAAVGKLEQEYPDLTIHGLEADIDQHLDLIPNYGTRLVGFLGGTIDNYRPAERHTFLSELAKNSNSGDTVLIGVDLIKDPQRLIRAYDDAAGVTAEFNINVLRVLNRGLGANFSLPRFQHVAAWNDEEHWIEMRLQAKERHVVDLGVLDIDVEFAKDEVIRTEVSTKFTRELIESEFVLAGLTPADWWSDGDYALALARKDA